MATPSVSTSLNATSARRPSRGTARSQPFLGWVRKSWVRKTHLYLGIFISPALIFFALTGALQTLSLHEAAGNSYQPAAWIAHLAQIHKKQSSQLRQRRPDTPSAGPAKANAAGPEKAYSQSPAHDASPHPAAPGTLASKLQQHLPLKLFFVLVSLGLLWSTFTGILMAYRFERSSALITALLVAGLLIPLALLRF